LSSIESSGKRYLIKNVSVTSFLRGLGLISSIVLDALVLGYFGLGKETAAFFAAWAVPLMIISAVEIQAPKVLIPVFTANLADHNEETAYFVIANLITFGMIILFLISILGITLAKVLIPIQVPGLSEDVTDLSISLCSILFWIIVIRGIASVFQSVLYTFHHFFVTGLAKFVISSVAALFLIIFHERIGIHALAFGFLAGSFVYLILLASVCFYKGFSYRFVCKFNDKKTVRILRLLFYPMVDHCFGEFRVLLENFLASFLGTASLSGLRYASRLASIVSGILLGSVVTAVVPLISHASATINYEDVKKWIQQAIKLLTLIGMPICVWLFFVCKPLLILLYERGTFVRADTTLICSILAVMLPYIYFTRLIGMMQVPFYSIQDMLTPLVSSIIFIIINVFCAVILINKVGVYSLPIAASFASFMTVIFLIHRFQKTFGEFSWVNLRSFGFRMCAVMLLTVFAFIAASGISSSFEAKGITTKILQIFIPSFLGALCFLISAVIFRVFQWKEMSCIDPRTKMLAWISKRFK